jgi:hypothetical protein
MSNRKYYEQEKRFKGEGTSFADDANFETPLIVCLFVCSLFNDDFSVIQTT